MVSTGQTAVRSRCSAHRPMRHERLHQDRDGNSRTTSQTSWKIDRMETRKKKKQKNSLSRG
ncbi:MAG: hypothetical protein F6K56_44645 [Moorea sp. SIO3G5]|nr:hypothetical protein [Moorena sp. SIO3G5]